MKGNAFMKKFHTQNSDYHFNMADLHNYKPVDSVIREI